MACKSGPFAQLINKIQVKNYEAKSFCNYQQFLHLFFNRISAQSKRVCSEWPIVWPPVLLLSRTTHPNFFTLNTDCVGL